MLYILYWILVKACSGGISTNLVRVFLRKIP